MHGEAFSTPCRHWACRRRCRAGETLGAFAPSEIGFPGGTLQLGSKAGAGFVFDNERQSHAFHVAPFRMDSGLVTNASMQISSPMAAMTTASSGAMRRGLADAAGAFGAALLAARRRQWRTMRFGKLSTLAGGEPVRHVNLYERRPIAPGPDAACRRKPSGNMPRFQATRHSAGASCGSGRRRRSSLTRV
jgi:hypothetical protein